VDRYIARKYGCNLFLSRLAEHGIDTPDAMVNLTADRILGIRPTGVGHRRQLGDKVILMGTSTGGTLALQLAATYPDQVAALVLMSPNIAINDPNAWLLNDHLGTPDRPQGDRGRLYHQQGRLRPAVPQYWYPKYRLEAVVALEELLETTMNRARPFQGAAAGRPFLLL
jgi:pimeloyl-ACP methyl ester carboxylesterase